MGFNLHGWPALLWVIVSLGYWIVCEHLWGATLGKRLLLDPGRERGGRESELARGRDPQRAATRRRISVRDPVPSSASSSRRAATRRSGSATGPRTRASLRRTDVAVRSGGAGDAHAISSVRRRGRRHGRAASVRRLAGTELPDDRAAAYLELLGVDATRGEVDAPTLAALARAHVDAGAVRERRHLPRPAAGNRAARPASSGCSPGAAGYCYHLNGAFATLLEWLEVDVTRHVSGVQGHAARRRSAPLRQPSRAHGAHARRLGVVRRRRARGRPGRAAPARLRPLRGGRVRLRAAPVDASATTAGGSSTTRAERSSAPTSRARPPPPAQFLEKHHELSTSPTLRLRPRRHDHAARRRRRRDPARLRALDDDGRRARRAARSRRRRTGGRS